MKPESCPTWGLPFLFWVMPEVFLTSPLPRATVGLPYTIHQPHSTGEHV